MRTDSDTPLAISTTLNGSLSTPVDTLWPLDEIVEKHYSSIAEEYLLSQYPKPASGDRNYHGSLDAYLGTTVDTSMDNINIGTYTNTNYDNAVGDHEGHNGTTLTIQTTGRSIKQSTDSATTKPRMNYPDPDLRLCYQDGNGDIREMDSDSIVRFGKRILSEHLNQEYAGAFRLALNSPTDGTWEMWNDQVYQDETAGGTTRYSLWRKLANSSLEESVINNTPLTGTPYPSTPALDVGDLVGTGYGLAVIDTTGTGVSLRQLSSSEESIAITQCVRHARKYTDIGRYRLLVDNETPNGEGETGVWSERGTILDTRNTVENLQYNSEPIDGSTRVEEYSAQYDGEYTSIRQEPTPIQYDGFRQTQFDGFRTNFQKGTNSLFAGSVQKEIVHQKQTNYAGQYTRFVDVYKQVNTTSYGEDKYIITAQANRSFEGPLQNFLIYINRSGPAAYVRYYTGQYLRIDANRFINYVTASYFNGFLGGRGFQGSGKYQLVNKSFARYYIGTGYFSRVVSYAGTRQFTGQYTQYFVVYLTTYGTIQVNRPFAGERQFDGQRQWLSPYTGQRTFDGQYTGERQFDGQYTGPTPIQRPSIIQVPYTGNFTGQYTGYSNASFTEQFTISYDGSTVTNPTETINSYTLWVKVSE